MLDLDDPFLSDADLEEAHQEAEELRELDELYIDWKIDEMRMKERGIEF